MRCLSRCLVMAGMLLVLPSGVTISFGQDGAAGPSPAKQAPTEKTLAAVIDVQALAERARKAVVAVSFADRDKDRGGLGTGFVISRDGLIATNLHVIGEARPITVEFPETGKQYAVQSIHASERGLDLAIVKIDAKDLPALELGDSAAIKQGQSVAALGNPYGLKQSVVQGVVSGRRTIDGKPMIQLAIPIEPGNSGGPLLDAHGKVQGILTLKSAVTQNLGFAVEINALKPLLAKPNPVPISRWLTIGALDAKEWRSYLGARWRQRAGRIVAEGDGSGFGKRTYALWQGDLPAAPYEATVTVRLDDESGAAGLIFEAEDPGPPDAKGVDAGEKKHYGFYPTGGQLRLARFEGRDVNTWQVLQTVPSDHYRRGEWNTIKVRVEADKILCSVNDQLVIKSTDRVLRGGRVGLAKFRETKAEFRAFRVGNSVPSSQPEAKVRARLERLAADVPPRGPVHGAVNKFLPDGRDSVRLLRERAAALEQQAKQLRHLAGEVHHEQVIRQLAKAAEGADDKLDLLHCGLLIARLDNDEVEVEPYQRLMDRLAAELSAALPKSADEKQQLAALNTFFFTEYGFHGSRTNYYHRSNSYLNEVLDDREGLPITLSVVYMELARRIGLNVVGVGLPRHFVVKQIRRDGSEQLLDVFDGGQALSREEAEKVSGVKLTDEHLRPTGSRAILVRMLGNLLSLAQDQENNEASLRYLDAVVAVAPQEGNHRAMRAVLRWRLKRTSAALADCDWLLKHRPEGVDLDRVQQLQDFIEKFQQ